MDSDNDSAQGSWLTTALLATGVVILVFIYNEWYNRTLRGYGLPGPRGLPIIGNMVPALRMGFAEYEDYCSKIYGDVFAYRIGQSLNIVIKDEDILKEILVKDFGNFTHRKNPDMNPKVIDKQLFFVGGSEWKRLRKILSPTFTAGKMKLMMNDINRCARVLAEHLDENISDSVDMKTMFGAFTMDTIAATAFGLETDSFKEPDGPFISKCRELFVDFKFSIIILFALAFPWTTLISKPLGLGFFKPSIVHFFVREVKDMVKERKRVSRTRTDFLQLLINAELDEKETDVSLNAQKKLTNEEISAQASLFFVAGYETTASLLRYTAYELAVHQDVQDRLLEEINDEISDAEPTYEKIANLRYMEQVLCEVLRLFPPLGRVNRQASETRTIKGITFPRGERVTVPIYEIHHDSRFYDDPEEFKPERFEEKNSHVNNIAFLPFGFGPRVCIGMRLAMAEAKVALVHILRKVRFSPGPDTEVPLKVRNLGLVVPMKPVKLKIERRSGATEKSGPE